MLYGYTCVLQLAKDEPCQKKKVHPRQFLRRQVLRHRVTRHPANCRLPRSAPWRKQPNAAGNAKPNPMPAPAAKPRLTPHRKNLAAGKGQTPSGMATGKMAVSRRTSDTCSAAQGRATQFGPPVRAPTPMDQLGQAPLRQLSQDDARPLAHDCPSSRSWTLYKRICLDRTLGYAPA